MIQRGANILQRSINVLQCSNNVLQCSIRDFKIRRRAATTPTPGSKISIIDRMRMRKSKAERVVSS